MWYHPSYYKRLAEIRKEEERKEKEKKALTKKEQSDSMIEQDKESISDCLEFLRVFSEARPLRLFVGPHRRVLL